MFSEKLYQIGIRLYGWAINTYAPYHKKAALWVEGRKDWEQKLKYALHQLPPDQPRIWVHVASLGEFEQGRPVISALHAQYPEYLIILSFFSPSGYEVRKNYPEAAHVCYLPLDTPDNAFNFVQIVQPSLAIFVKYEFWYNHLTALEHWGVPVYLIAARFRDNQIFFRPWGHFFRRMLSIFDAILVQDIHSETLLRKIGLTQIHITGDSRVDRVLQIADAPEAFPEIETFARDAFIVVFGSSWEPDEAIFCRWINEKLPPGWKIIIAPHETGTENIRRLQQLLQIPSATYSQIADRNPDARVLIIDNVGMLAQLYQFASIAYVGGGFGKGIHSILEPTAFGIPVVVGPRYHKFEEAVVLKSKGALFAIQHYSEFCRIMNNLEQEALRKEIHYTLKQYFDSQRGATQKTLQILAPRLD